MTISGLGKNSRGFRPAQRPKKEGKSLDVHCLVPCACVVVGVVGATDLFGSDIGGTGVCRVSCVDVDCTLPPCNRGGY